MAKPVTADLSPNSEVETTDGHGWTRMGAGLGHRPCAGWMAQWEKISSAAGTCFYPCPSVSIRGCPIPASEFGLRWLCSHRVGASLLRLILRGDEYGAGQARSRTVSLCGDEPTSPLHPCHPWFSFWQPDFRCFSARPTPNGVGNTSSRPKMHHKNTPFVRWRTSAPFVINTSIQYERHLHHQKFCAGFGRFKTVRRPCDGQFRCAGIGPRPAVPARRLCSPHPGPKTRCQPNGRGSNARRTEPPHVGCHEF